MDDHENGVDDPRLNDRLKSWFDAEVHEARVDLHRSTLRAVRGPAMRSRMIGGSLTLLALIAIVIAAGTSRLPLISPGNGPSPDPSVGNSDTAPPTIVQTNPPPSPPAATAIVGARYADGIPSRLDGAPVLRPTSIAASAPGDDSSFLIGGWSFDFGAIVIACSLMVVVPPPYGPRCGTQFLAETPTYGGEVLVLLDRWTSAIPAGPVVLRVHRHDRRAETCTPEARNACESMAVIEAAVWTGDDVTAALPITAIQAVNRLVGADPAFASADLSTIGGVSEVTHPVPIKLCVAPYPLLTWTVSGSKIDTLLVFPSVAAREAVDQDFRASGFVGTSSEGAVSCVAIFDAAFSHTWVSGENVMVAIQTNIDGPTPAQAALIKAVRAALNGP